MSKTDSMAMFSKSFEILLKTTYSLRGQAGDQPKALVFDGLGTTISNRILSCDISV